MKIIVTYTPTATVERFVENMTYGSIVRAFSATGLLNGKGVQRVINSYI